MGLPVLTDAERELLQLLKAREGKRFTPDELIDGTKFTPKVAEAIISSLESRGLVEVRTTLPQRAPESNESLEDNLNAIQEILERVAKLSEKKSTTKEIVFERVRDRLNEQLSSAVANFEFSVDKTHDRLDQIAKGIQELRDKIDETALLVDVGEISEREGNVKKREYHDQIQKLENQQSDIFNTGWRSAKSKRNEERSDKSVEGVKAELEELEVRKQVGEFDGKERDFKEKKARILGEITTITKGEFSANEMAKKLSQMGKTLASANMLNKESFNRLSRACERLTEMSSLESGSHRK